ncbi:MAG TPA: Hsp20/alpha crystallin family protein [Usitatibacter sp.]|nr:Hsp20/alpha crystallin family protein [Usitatibacter sp.]
MFPSLTRFPGELFPDFEALQRQVEQLLGASSWPSSIRAAGRGAFPAINMGVTADAVEIYAFAPGLDPGRIDVSLDKGLLVISGERADELPQESDKVSIYADERFSGAFRRAITLPEDADPGRVEASYRNGVLRIVVPKRESAKPRRVEVKDAAA